MCFVPFEPGVYMYSMIVSGVVEVLNDILYDYEDYEDGSENDNDWLFDLTEEIGKPLNCTLDL